jgi:hypothetical protein
MRCYHITQSQRNDAGNYVHTTVPRGLSTAHKWEVIPSRVHSACQDASSDVHHTNGRNPTACPCPQVQDDEFAGYDMGTVPRRVMFARLSYRGLRGRAEILRRLGCASLESFFLLHTVAQDVYQSTTGPEMS